MRIRQFESIYTASVRPINRTACCLKISHTIHQFFKVEFNDQAIRTSIKTVRSMTGWWNRT